MSAKTKPREVGASRGTLLKPKSISEQYQDQNDPVNKRFGNFELKKSGVFHLAEVKRKDDDGNPITEITPVFVSGWLNPVALTRDHRSDGWGVMLEFYDPDGHLHSWVMPMKLIRAGGEEIRAALLDQGLTNIATTNKAKGLLLDYILSACQKLKADGTARARTVSITGWSDSPSGLPVFVLPNRIIGTTGERTIYTGDDPHRFDSAGSLSDWIENVALPCHKNSRLQFAISVALAGSLHHFTHTENSGFNLLGFSGDGKTTTLQVAASLFGNPKKIVNTWNATANGLEAAAMLNNDGCLINDELKQLQPEIAGQTAYLIMNGGGRSRATITGGSKGESRWKLNLLSSGEIGLGDLVNAKGGRLHAGQEGRLADVPVDAGAGMGIFNDCHGETPQNFAESLKKNAHKYYGTAFSTFVEKITQQDQFSFRDELHTMMNTFITNNRPDQAHAQTLRMLNRFAVAAVAGELATRWAITGWGRGDALEAVAICFRAWLDHKGGAGQQEERELLNQVRLHFIQDGLSRYIHLRKNDQGREYQEDVRVINSMGYRRATIETTVSGDDSMQIEYFLPSETFQQLTRGFETKWAASVLVQHGLLQPGNDGRLCTLHRIGGLKRSRYYHIIPDAIEEKD